MSRAPHDTDPSSRPTVPFQGDTSHPSDLDTGRTALGGLEPLEVGETGVNHLAHYALLEQVGRGSMGVVHRARDTILDRQVAVKVLSEDLSHQKSFRDRFVKEARIVARMSDPNIPHVYFVGRVRNQLFFAMEWIEGENLQDRLRRGPLDVREALDITRQVASGLARAHKAGIVHRDIKPSNVLLTPEGVAKVLDFGIAQEFSISAGSSNATFAGTPHYASPEQARGQPAGPRSDIYSLGAVLFELITGRTPFEGNTPQEQLRARLSSATPQLPEELSGSAAVRTLVARMMAQASEDRIPDCDSLVRAIDRVYPGPVVPASFPRRGLAALTDGLVLALPVILVWLVLFAVTGRFPTTPLLDSPAGRLLFGLLVAGAPVALAMATCGRNLRSPGFRLQELRWTHRDKPLASRRARLLRSLSFWLPVGALAALQPGWPPLPASSLAAFCRINWPLTVMAAWSLLWILMPLVFSRRWGPGDWLTGLEVVQSVRDTSTLRGAELRGLFSPRRRGEMSVASVLGWSLLALLAWAQIGTDGPVRYSSLTLVETVRAGDPGFDRMLRRFAGSHLQDEQRIDDGSALVFQRRALHPLIWARTEGDGELRIEDRRLGTMLRGRFAGYEPFHRTYHGGALWEADELVPVDDAERQLWERERAQAYQGSVPHFLRALMHGRIAEEGFVVENPAAFQGMFRLGDEFLLVVDGGLDVLVSTGRAMRPARLTLERGFLRVDPSGRPRSGSAKFGGLWQHRPQPPGETLERYAAQQGRDWQSPTEEIRNVTELR